MKKLKFKVFCTAICIVLVSVISIVFIPGMRSFTIQWWEKGLGIFGIHMDEGQEITYWCPMHHDVKRKKAGVCPICNMALVELKEETKENEEGFLILTDRQVQQAGVRTDYVKYRNLVREIDTSGRITYDERRLVHVTSWISGSSRIEKLYVNFTGQAVKKGELLMELYSPSLITSLEEYRLAIETLRKFEDIGNKQDIQNAKDLVTSTQKRLLQWGLREKQINEFETTKFKSLEMDNIPIYSPISGTVIEKLIEEGQYVNEGSMLMHIADLSTVWLLADIFEYELHFLKLGQEVNITTRSLPGEIFKGEVIFIEPFLQEETQTIRIRCDIDNTNLELKPGMYARAQIWFDLPHILSVPESAVLHSGRREIVFIDEGNGRYRPTEVNLGRKWLYHPNQSPIQNRGLGFGADAERYHEVLSGLEPEDIVVIAGNFLLNAESQFQGVLKKMIPVEKTLHDKKRVTLSTEIQKEMNNVLGRYFTIQASLADDSLKDLDAQIDVIRESVQKAIEISEDTQWEGRMRPPRWIGQDIHTYLEDLKTILESVKPDSDIAEMRDFFGDLSKHIIEYLKNYTESRDRELYIFSCPMAPGYGKWLQKGTEINNPYMGKVMLRCGNPAELE
ncbi:MAG: efflux RND transporter periplasmic adaptor subunit [Candidatus Scalinduaceae bacterium]